jgi:hypothetical protein
MERTISCDTFSWFLLLSVGLVLIAARLTRGNGRPPTDVALRDVGRLPAWPDRIANRVPGHLTQTGPRCGRTGVREPDIPGLEGYARQFEEASEKIRLRLERFRGRGDLHDTITIRPRPATSCIAGRSARRFRADRVDGG